MSPLAILKLVGFATGAALHLYLCWLLVRRRGVEGVARVVLALGATVGFWHLGNFIATAYELLEVPGALWWLKSGHVVAYVALALLPPVGFHAQMRVWEMMDAGAPRRLFTPFIRFGYVPLVLLPWVVVNLWREPYVHPVERLSNLHLPFTHITLVFAFMLWTVVVLWECAGVSFRLSRRLTGARERRFFQILAIALAAQGAMNLTTYIFGARHWQTIGPYVEAVAMLGSIVPTAIIAYYIYRYRYLEIVIRQSLVYAAVAVIVMMIYLYGIRTLSGALETRYGLRSSVIEALLILAMVFLAGPLRRVTERYVKSLFVREVGLYRDLVAQVGTAATSYGETAQLTTFLERRLAEALQLSRVRIIPVNSAESAVAGVCQTAEEQQWTQVEDDALLKQLDALSCDVLWREGRVVGLLLAGGSAPELTAEKREVLTVVSGHIAAALENCQLLEEKVKLERALAERERLASLGQMAATVAHEIKNPLSAIKSITQVMREDEQVSREYARDLDLITGEVDRLSRSVSQLLSFSRPAVVAASPARLSEVVSNALLPAHSETAERGVEVTANLPADPVLDGVTVTAMREILGNLLLNAVQATGRGGRVTIESGTDSDGRLRVSVTDEGIGVPRAMQEKVFEPFFTTKQRGTGLGLAIVARRARDIDADIRLTSPAQGERGTIFALTLPLKVVSSDDRPEPESEIFKSQILHG
ncbi:MAG TPA: ATP-binding protein [Blastocatellia bacterium]|nr:ATP-binding protein [Blastocatellia bacterium]